MKFKKPLKDLILAADLAGFEKLLKDNLNDPELVPDILDSMYNIAVANGLSFLNLVLEIPGVRKSLETNHAARKAAVLQFLKCCQLPLIECLFADPLFKQDILGEPQSALTCAAQNIYCAAEVIDKIHALLDTRCLSLEQLHSIWLISCGSKHRAETALLTLHPELYRHIDDINFKKYCGQTPDNIVTFLRVHTSNYEVTPIDTYFMDQYFADLQERMRKWPAIGINQKSQFDVGSRETELACLVLRTLLWTYPFLDKIARANQIQHEVLEGKANTFLTSFSKGLQNLGMLNPDNQHLKRVEVLLAIPSVRRRVIKDCKEFMKLVGIVKQDDARGNHGQDCADLMGPFLKYPEIRDAIYPLPAAAPQSPRAAAS